MNLKKVWAVILSVSAMLTATACDKNDETLTKGATLFTIGDAVMTDTEFMGYVSNYTMYGYPMDVAKETAKSEAIKNLSLNALVTEFSEEEEKKIEEQKSKIIEAQGGNDGYKEFIGMLKTDDRFVDNLIRAQFATNKLFPDVESMEFSDEEIKDYFDKNYYRAKHILISTMDTATQTEYDDAKQEEQKKKADELLNRAKSGEDFDALVAEFSEDPGSKSQPDGYYFTENEMVAEFEATTKALGMNEIEICKTMYGYHIIKRLPLDEDMDLYNENLENVTEKIKSILPQKYMETEIDRMLKEKGLELITYDKVFNSIKEEQ